MRLKEVVKSNEKGIAFKERGNLLRHEASVILGDFTKYRQFLQQEYPEEIKRYQLAKNSLAAGQDRPAVTAINPETSGTG